jgi:hypothetical protein
VLLSWITYSCCSGHLILLYEIPLQVVGKKRDAPESFHVAQQIQKDIGTAVHSGDMEVFTVAYVSGYIARRCFIVSTVMQDMPYI